MPVNIPPVSDKSKLYSVLRGIDISVPLRTEGRKTDHTETRIICHLLATLAEYACLRYPLSLNHRDRPDFLLCNGMSQVGVEITEAASEQYNAYSALAEKEFPGAFLEPGHFRSGAPERTVEQMRTLLQQTQLSAAPWEGDRPEREWAVYMERVVDSKLEKLAKPGFRILDENWLAIYDNLPLPNVEMDKAIRFLHLALETPWSRIPGFSLVFIESGSVIVKLSPIEVHTLDLYDLW